MTRIKLTLVIAFFALGAMPKTSSAQTSECRAFCEYYFDEFDNPWHRNPIVPWYQATDMCDGDGCHSDWLAGTCTDWHNGCAAGLMSIPSQEAMATNNVEALRKLLAAKDTPLRLSKDGTVIQLLGCNGRVVMQKPLTKEMQTALKS